MRRLETTLSGIFLGTLGSAFVAASAFAEGTGADGSADGFPDPAAGWDHLWKEVLTDITVIGVVFMIAALYMLIKFRAKSPDQVGGGRKLTAAQAVAWALIPASLFMADDFFLAANGWTQWNVQRRVPANAMEIKVTGQQWYWSFEYPDGTETDQLVVPIGQPIVLRMSSDDVIHSFGMPAYRVTEDVMPGRITYIWFNPDKPMDTVVTCREFCGMNHSVMYTKVRAVPQKDYEAWLKKQAAAG
ncbi:cytochrome c oxidase subunit II [Varunaivibrio sulfuroxidans]|uniref:Cytochrome aa3 subunit 2 n=1 Tax=Varunaivibrio sulfuroxidans TaxID=1773489 RepID=A0A4R3JBH3_9PROT|nr:cytochrome c oxidase subunit II [Varunaivibrio sulfuroxidans]TCS62645.1 cytochrome c oxidase subunit 2 [Varunaivibrio sulfuroxidans]WES30689.1 cytochrome c oxidase subunit II [Varunaivibrio sulfuroxidans]